MKRAIQVGKGFMKHTFEEAMSLSAARAASRLKTGLKAGAIVDTSRTKIPFDLP